jgi:hypothetical protein
MLIDRTPGGVMDPYDAIVEQLRGARERQRQSLEQRLAGVLESLESAAASIRDAVAEPVDEAFPLDDVESSLNDLRQAAAEAAVPPPPPPVTLEVLRALDGAGSQSDLLHALLSELARHAARAVVLVFRPDGVGAWSAIGFDDVSRLGRWSCGRDDSEIFARFADDATPVHLSPVDDDVIRGWLEGETAPDEALLVPISLRGRIMGAVYVDRLPEGPWDPDAVQVLVAIACWMIDTLKYRAGATSPPLRAMAAAEAVAAGVGADAVIDEIEEIREAEEEAESIEAAEEVAAAEETAVGEETAIVEETAVAEETLVAEEPLPAVAALDELASEPGFDPSATVQVEPAEQASPVVGDVEITVETSLPDFDSELGPSDGEPGLPDQAAESAVGEDDAAPDVAEFGAMGSEAPPLVEPVAPPPVEPVTPPADFRREADAVAAEGVGGLSFEDQSQHEEARRFARLLVSEIKLYNEDAVERGREQRDLYQRLKDDIDRSREMYEKRIPADIRAAHDHFRDELVRILAGGDVEALGM